MREESDAGAVERGWVVGERIEERDWLVQVQVGDRCGRLERWSMGGEKSYFLRLVLR